MNLIPEPHFDDVQVSYLSFIGFSLDSGIFLFGSTRECDVEPGRILSLDFSHTTCQAILAKTISKFRILHVASISRCVISTLATDTIICTSYAHTYKTLSQTLMVQTQSKTLTDTQKHSHILKDTSFPTV